MNNKTKTTLKNLGLTNGEIKVYCALIKTGNSTVGPIIKEAKVSNSKIYLILNNLIEKGLVTYITKEKTKYFQAAQPLSLIDYADKKEKELKQTKTQLKEVVSIIQNTVPTPNISEDAKIYRGYNGIRTGLFEAIKTIPIKGEYYFFSTGYGGDPYLKRFFKKLAIELKQRKITIKGLANKKEKKLFDNYYKKLGYKMKYLNLEFPSDITIAGDYLIIFVWNKAEPIIYSLYSKTLISSYLNFFSSLWDN